MVPRFTIWFVFDLKKVKTRSFHSYFRFGFSKRLRRQIAFIGLHTNTLQAQWRTL